MILETLMTIVLALLIICLILAVGALLYFIVQAIRLEFKGKRSNPE